MWYDSIQKYKNFTLLFEPVSHILLNAGNIPTERKYPVVLIWHESGKVLKFDSYSYVPLMPVLVNDMPYYLREEKFINYENSTVCRINTLFPQDNRICDEWGIGYAADVSTLSLLGSTDRTCLDCRKKIINYKKNII